MTAPFEELSDSEIAEKAWEMRHDNDPKVRLLAMMVYSMAVRADREDRIDYERRLTNGDDE